MGCVIDFINSLVAWVSEVIKKVLEWLKEYQEFIEDKNRKFLLKNESKIKNAHDPKRFAKVSTEYNAINELKKIADNEKKKLDNGDQAKLRELFDDDPEFFKE